MTPTPQYSIVVGRNNAGSLVRWNTLKDGNNVEFLDPAPGWTGYREGERVMREDLSIVTVGFPADIWVIPLLLATQYKVIKDAYDGKGVTIKTTIDGITFANFNATLTIEDPADMMDRWQLFGGEIALNESFVGWGWVGVQITFLGLEAL